MIFEYIAVKGVGLPRQTQMNRIFCSVQVANTAICGTIIGKDVVVLNGHGDCAIVTNINVEDTTISCCCVVGKVATFDCQSGRAVVLTNDRQDTSIR